MGTGQPSSEEMKSQPSGVHQAILGLRTRGARAGAGSLAQVRPLASKEVRELQVGARPPGQESGQAALGWAVEMWHRKGNKCDEACRCELVKLLVGPALSSEMLLVRAKQNKKLNIIHIYTHIHIV